MANKLVTFRIKTRGGSADRRGYVVGRFAAHKEPGPGVYFWTFTHLDSGMSVNVYPPHETKASALAHLQVMHEQGAGDEAERLIAGCPKLGE